MLSVPKSEQISESVAVFIILQIVFATRTALKIEEYSLRSDIAFTPVKSSQIYPLPCLECIQQCSCVGRCPLVLTLCLTERRKGEAGGEVVCPQRFIYLSIFATSNFLRARKRCEREEACANNVNVCGLLWEEAHRPSVFVFPEPQPLAFWLVHTPRAGLTFCSACVINDSRQN